jgi:exosortase
MTTNSIESQPRLIVARPDIVRVGLALVLVGLVGYAYWGQPAEGNMATFSWLYGHWQRISHYSHGPLIPLIALGIAWWKRREILAQRIEPVGWGAVLVALTMLLYYVGVKAVQPRVTVISFVLLLYSLTFALGGRGLFRVLFFPISFLFLMIPLNFLEERIGLPLRHLMAWASTGILNLMGIETVRRGTAILSNVFHFDVANPCSGIQSLMALTTVTAAYAYITQTAQWKRWFLFLSAVPLAVLGNLARVTSIALVAQAYGQELASKAYHDWSGYVVFGVALSAMVGLGWLLDFPYRQTWARWTKSAQPPPATV